MSLHYDDDDDDVGGGDDSGNYDNDVVMADNVSMTLLSSPSSSGPQA